VGDMRASVSGVRTIKQVIKINFNYLKNILKQTIKTHMYIYLEKQKRPIIINMKTN
jgi:hypothetical protein